MGEGACPRYSISMALIDNRKATFDYEILETLQAGIELHGFEVKSLRAGRGQLAGARVIARGGEAFLVGVSIPPWQPGNAPKEYDQERPRKLLLSKAEILKIAQAEEKQGLTIVPLSVYNSNRMLKVDIAIARGKKTRDKRSTIREREEKRNIERTLKRNL